MSNNCIKRLITRIFCWSYVFAVKEKLFKDSLITTDPRIFEELLMNAAKDFGVEILVNPTDQKKERYIF